MHFQALVQELLDAICVGSLEEKNMFPLFKEVVRHLSHFFIIPPKTVINQPVEQ